MVERWLKTAGLYALFMASLLAGIALPGCGGGSAADPQNNQPSEPVEPITRQISLKGRVFTLELALDNDARTLGLSDRKAIAEDGGMLFVFPRPDYAQFVMRRCYVPIDLIYVDEKGYIDSTHAMQVIEPVGGARWKNPRSGYPSVGPIVLAIELQGGMIDTLGLKRGEKLDLPIAELQSRAE